MEQPNHEPDIARAAQLIASASRARMLKALSDGRRLAASVLAEEAGVSPATASVHLGRLTEAGLVVVEDVGRHRYYRLAGPEITTALEALAVIAPATDEPVTSLRASSRAKALRRARTCYDHLAGVVGVALMRSLVRQDWLTRRVGGTAGAHGTDRPASYGRALEYRMTAPGRERFEAFGIDVDQLLSARRPAVRYCVDWSEQRHHLAGALGSALTQRFFDLNWLRYGSAPRVVHLTDAGRRGLSTAFGVLPAD
ncbi:ArsR/SmtB family transcription factor [Streptomyces sp. URMC 123]|uniref:ArsR/SmtB family transcription factor n=1 Tax=Streptomyces sp. URMC 123 TaxID=3423403 RepID=UPI003F1DC5A8